MIRCHQELEELDATIVCRIFLIFQEPLALVQRVIAIWRVAWIKNVI
jgi:hypothetical protein